MKFNDFFLGCVGTGLKRYANELGYNSFEKIGTWVPVSLRPPPKSLETPLVFQNCIGMGTWEFSWVNNFEEGMKKGKSSMRRFKLALMWSSQKIQLSLKYMPEFTNKYLIKALSSTGKMGVSNIPGMKREITMGGYALKDSYFITPNVLGVGLCILGCSYNGKFRYCVYQDTAMEAKANKIVDHIEKIIQSEMDKLIVTIPN